MKNRTISILWALVFLLAFVGCASAEKAAPEPVSQPVAPESPDETTGIEVVSLRQTAAGHLVDLRYRVTDPVKASAVFDRQNKAYIIDQATGTKLAVPRMAKVGPLRQTNFKPDAERVYFILFDNPGGLLKSGSLVTLEIGDWRLENLVVQ